MIINKNIDIRVNSNNMKYLKEFNDNIKNNDIIQIPIEKLSKNSHLKIDVKCDVCGLEKNISYFSYVRNIKNSNIYTCQKCSIEKYKLTNIEKYGVEFPIQSKEIKERRKKNNIEKYNVDEPSKLESIKEKIRITKKLKYDDENYNNKEKTKETKKLKYDNINYNNREKANTTCIQRYGVENVSQSETIKNKKRETSIKNYNVDNYSKSDIYKIDRIDILKEKYKNINILNVCNNKLILNCDCNKCHNYEIDITVLRNRIIYKTILCTVCNPISSYSNSGHEINIRNFIKENYNKEIILNNRNIIKPYELDIYLPDLKFALEFNGLYWHCEMNKESNYHLNKTEECEKHGLQLLHIFEDDWLNKQNIVKSILLNKLDVLKNTINLTNCKIKEIDDSNLIEKFLNDNHIQGFVDSKISIGLFYNDEIVSLMVFSKTNNQYELLRFCNKINTKIVDSEKELFNYFINNYNPTKIIAYADRSNCQGEIYKSLNFNFINKIEPAYSYIFNGIRQNKNNFKKETLIRQGYDSNKTEQEIMIERKIYKIYDSGYLKFVYTK